MNPLCTHFMCKNWLNYQIHPRIQHHNFFKFVWQNSQRCRPFNALSNAKFLRDLIFQENQQSRSKSIRYEQNKKAHKQRNISKFQNKISIHYTAMVNLKVNLHKTKLKIQGPHPYDSLLNRCTPLIGSERPKRPRLKSSDLSAARNSNHLLQW